MLYFPRPQYVFIPAKYKDCYLAYILNELSGSTAMVGSGIGKWEVGTYSICCCRPQSAA